MSRFFGRRAAVTVGRAAPLLAVRAASPLRIQFRVEKQLYTPPNTADISITNLSEDTRRGMQQTGAEVILEAGYADAADADGHYPLLFHGDARTIDHIRHGTEWVTRIQCGDGEVGYRYAQANLSRPPGTAKADVAKALAQALQPSGIDVSAFLGQLGGALQFEVPDLAGGYAAQGNALEEFQKLAAPEGWIVSIQNGQLQVVTTKGTTLGQQTVPLISAETGMLGSPEHGSPDKNGLESILKVSSLLLPQLVPGNLFKLEAEGNAGNYRAQKVVHTGDTHGGDWKTEIEAWPM